MSEDTNKKPVKIDKWDGCAVKNALDDGVRKIFSEDLEYLERFYLCDIRLALCTVAVVIALFALLWDWLHPFPASGAILAFCALSYFFITVVATLYVQFVERGIFYVGFTRDLAKKIDGCQAVRLDVKIWSTPKRYDDEYALTIQLNGSLEYPPGESKTGRVALVTKTAVCSATEFIDVNGVVLVDDHLKNKVIQLYSDAANDVIDYLQGKKDK